MAARYFPRVAAPVVPAGGTGVTDTAPHASYSFTVEKKP